MLAGEIRQGDAVFEERLEQMETRHRRRPLVVGQLGEHSAHPASSLSGPSTPMSYHMHQQCTRSRAAPQAP
jgi:hypothetical protein